MLAESMENVRMWQSQSQFPVQINDYMNAQIRETLSSFLQFANNEHQVIYIGPIGKNFIPSDLLEEKK